MSNSTYGAIPTEAASANVTTVDITGEESNNIEDKDDWHVKLGERLESRKAHWFVLGLIALDTLCVLTEIVVSLFDECGSTEILVGEIVIEIAEGLSLFITVLFALEILLTLLAFGPGYYLPYGHQPHWFLHFLDALVITTTLFFEIVLRGKEREVIGLLIIFRFWRIIKIMEAIALGVSYGADEEQELAIKNYAETKAELEKEKMTVTKLSKQIEELTAARTKLEQQVQQLSGNAA